MTTFTAKQIAAIKELKQWSNTQFHGNRKTSNGLPVELIKQIVSTKRMRANRACEPITYTPAQKTHELIRYAKTIANTNYAKIMIEGNAGIYLAHPAYKHKDHNKSRVFDKNGKTLRLMSLYNSIVSKF